MKPGDKVVLILAKPGSHVLDGRIGRIIRRNVDYQGRGIFVVYFDSKHPNELVAECALIPYLGDDE